MAVGDHVSGKVRSHSNVEIGRRRETEQSVHPPSYEIKPIDLGDISSTCYLERDNVLVIGVIVASPHSHLCDFVERIRHSGGLVSTGKGRWLTKKFKSSKTKSI